ncbi:monovalent cation/H(+) antiporter subunit G [Rhodococcus sp. HNM0569]|uniref:monovalent cation/H(+) antiporter subunit G n=1 Tax=Rhodococcus sp. HNM0569 TaxID=2716340 RepID=UPI00146F60BB|nr:monovalent cation/H(+) antiporter subunit G [Rhodococcus sp. HNM0569]NLU83516.1 monovalent cation/H(+) antiporter subunit G [Rhodococcus sp. HNM0569]
MTVVGTVLLVLGALVFAAGAIGLVRLPDMYSRVSAITTASGLGISLIIIGVLFLDPGWGNAVKALAAVVINLATSAVGGNAIGRAGYLAGAPLSDRTRYDELAR